MFGCKPSDTALLDESVGEVGRFYFDRGIWAFGKHVANRLDEAGQSQNPSIARAQREREWGRLMRIDTTTTGFRDVDPGSLSPHARVVGDVRDDDEIIVLD